MDVTNKRWNKQQPTVKDNQCSHHYLMVLVKSEGDTTWLRTDLDQLRPGSRKAVIRKKRYRHENVEMKTPMFSRSSLFEHS